VKDDFEVWFRPAGTRVPGRPAPTLYNVWYRVGPNGHPETNTNGGVTWATTIPSREFHSMDAMRNSGLCYRVAGIGKTLQFDDDLCVDEGL